MASVIRKLSILDGRPGFQLQSTWGRVSVLEGGGLICELILIACGDVITLWKPSWKTVDLATYSPRKYARIYGPLPEGRLLGGNSRHSNRCEYFGFPCG